MFISYRLQVTEKPVAAVYRFTLNLCFFFFLYFLLNKNTSRNSVSIIVDRGRFILICESVQRSGL